MINSDITAERLQEIFDDVESGFVLCSSTNGDNSRRLSYDWRAKKFVAEFWNVTTDETHAVRVDTVADAADAYNKMGHCNV